MSTLVLAAHPDDEALGAGGWMAKYPGCQVAVMTDGEGSRDLADRGLRRAHRLAALEKAVHGLGADLIAVGDFPDQQLAITNLDLHAAVAKLLTAAAPTTVLTHHPHELNADHRVLAEVVSILCRAFTPAGRSIQRVLSFAVDAWAQPGQALTFTTFCALTLSQLQQKLAAVACYSEELRPWPHPRNLDALEAYHRWVGAVSGSDAAEPYSVLWERA